MSWLFGVKAPIPAEPDAVSPPASAGGGDGDGNEEPPGPAASAESVGQRMAYQFDSRALERAAQAAKDLERSSHASQALDLSKEQERTRQLELETQIKQYEAGISENKINERRVAEEERRKTLEYEGQQAKYRAEYEDKLARKRHEDELAGQRRNQEDIARRQEESVRKQEEMRRATLEHEIQKRSELDMNRVEAEARARAKVERENHDLALEQTRVTWAERRKTVLEAIQTGSTALGAGLQAFVTDWRKISYTAGGLSLLAIGVYGAKHSTGVLARVVEARIAKPSLIRDTSRLTLTELIKHPIKTFRHWREVFAGSDKIMSGVIFKPTLESSLLDVALTTRNTRTNRGLYRNIMFYGPPGTGKTMFAKRLALKSGMNYAIMTGGDVAPMGPDGVSAMHKVFDWAEASRKGLLLFVDEADAFLRQRSVEKISEDMRATLNAFLYRTGEQSNKFMLVLASNQPEQFDWAINDRVDEMVEFDIPGREERERMILHYFNVYIATPATSGSRRNRLKLGEFDWVNKCKGIAGATAGLSGREISKLVIACQASAYASGDGVLTESMMDRRVEDTMRQHAQKVAWKQREVDPGAGPGFLSPKAEASLNVPPPGSKPVKKY